MSEIRLQKVRKEYKGIVAVRDVTETFPTSSVTCLLGPSGCGKTTLLRMIAGLEEPTSGEIYFDDQRVTNLPPSKRNIGMVFQYPVVYRGITAYQNIELPLLQDKIAPAERRRRVESVVEILGLRDSIDKDITQLDNSERQKVAVARAVARQPQIILFDEPITNVDVNSKVQLKQALKDVTRQLDQTIVYVTHDQTEAMTLADEIALMKDGVIMQRDAPRALYNNPNDVFGGWFLGNPGMDFFDEELTSEGDIWRLASPLFPNPLVVKGADSNRKVGLGIRPEYIRVNSESTLMSVRARTVHKSIVVGGQYLLTLQVADRTFKAKVPAEVGHAAGIEVWVELPIDRLTLFSSEGHRLDVQIAAPGAGSAPTQAQSPYAPTSS
jgi:ABC-type sugar transport system ATPase subunit